MHQEKNISDKKELDDKGLDDVSGGNHMLILNNKLGEQSQTIEIEKPVKL